MKNFTRALLFAVIGLGVANQAYASELSKAQKAKLIAKEAACSARCLIGRANYAKMLKGDTAALSSKQHACMTKCVG